MGAEEAVVAVSVGTGLLLAGATLTGAALTGATLFAARWVVAAARGCCAVERVGHPSV